jgi:hypothetical protein
LTGYLITFFFSPTGVGKPTMVFGSTSSIKHTDGPIIDFGPILVPGMMLTLIPVLQSFPIKAPNLSVDELI